jgi:alpha-N-arabinofuranosidase
MCPATVRAQQAKLELDLARPGHAVSPMLYGLMTEEINHSYDGGLYAELVRNRSFMDDRKDPKYWSVVAEGGAVATMALDHQNPVSEALRVSLKFSVENAGARAGIANTGYWGIPVTPVTTYKGSLYVKSSASGTALDISLETPDGKTRYATTRVTGVTDQWARYPFTLKTAAGVRPTQDARLVIAVAKPGDYWFNLVSLFPPTYHDRPNGNRPDIMKLLAAMKPSFLRFPGGNYLEGNKFSDRFPWSKTLGPLQDRPGHESCWGYWSTDGMGLLEYLEWCEDLHMQPLLAVFAGYTLNRDYLTGPFLKPFVQDALNEIEYVIGDTTTVWGKRRAEDGHPAPFNLHYVEVGNEDGFDASGSYETRFVQFYDAIRARYPQLKIISTVGGKDGLGGRFPMTVRTPYAFDEHYYRNAWEMESDATHYDDYPRTGPKIFVGEWATREGSPTTNFNAALGDAAWMTGMERNSDVVVMASYAPLFVNVNPGGMQWKSDLIGYDVLKSYGSPSYYAQVMFSQYLGNRVVPVTGSGIPTQTHKLSDKDIARGASDKAPVMFYVATRDTASGTIYLKVVNVLGTAQRVQIVLKDAPKIQSRGQRIVLKADSPDETNTIDDPTRIVPVTGEVKGLGKSFTQSFDPYSITVLVLKEK